MKGNEKKMHFLEENADIFTDLFPFVSASEIEMYSNGTWKDILEFYNNGKAFWLLLKDLSKAFDCLSYELLLEKLHAYGFSFAALQLGHSCLRNRKQGANLNPKKKYFLRFLKDQN